MEKKIFEVRNKIRYAEMAHDLTIKPSALMLLLEDLASNNAEELDFGYTFVRKHNYAWVVLKYHMEFDSYPQNIQELKIKTEPRGYNKLFAFRDFELYSGDTRLGRVASTWSLIDMENRNIVSVQDVLSENDYMYKFEKRENDVVYEKIRPLQNIDLSNVYEIRYDDIDVNKHANNSNYIIWAFEPLDIEFRNKKILKSLDMVFKKEAKFGDKIVSEIEILGDKTNHVIKSQNTGDDLCLISATWAEK